jgi:hypothetical protein
MPSHTILEFKREGTIRRTETALSLRCCHIFRMNLTVMHCNDKYTAQLVLRIMADTTCISNAIFRLDNTEIYEHLKE